MFENCPFRFIPPSTPKIAPQPPSGARWLHEPKLDGWRIQAHKEGKRAVLYSRRGLDFTRRFPTIAAAIATLPAATAILDCELVALTADGKPDFTGLHRNRTHALRLYAFDLLYLDGLDFLEEPLEHRKALLSAQLAAHGHPDVREVAHFDGGAALFSTAEAMGLEGVVSKIRDAPYRSGPRCGWLKSKTASWREETGTGGGCSSGGKRGSG